MIARYFPGVDIGWLSRCAPFMPFAIRIHLAVSLVGLLSLGYYLSPAMDLHADATGILLGVIMAVVAIGMATGYHARWAAGLLLAAGPLYGRSESARCDPSEQRSRPRPPDVGLRVCELQRRGRMPGRDSGTMNV